jgi:hypothetical protein
VVREWVKMGGEGIYILYIRWSDVFGCCCFRVASVCRESSSPLRLSSERLYVLREKVD